jgi:hypothetical protein
MMHSKLFLGAFVATILVVGLYFFAIFAHY